MSGLFPFDSKAWKKLKPLTIELQKVYRQSNSSFYKILDSIREEINLYESIEKLNASCYKQGSKHQTSGLANTITLAFTNGVADDINETALSKLEGEVFSFRAEYWGNFDKRSCLAEDILKVKVGARVMLIKNHPMRLYVNGTLGTVKQP